MYLRPTALADALGVLAARRPAILAGGTDFYPALVGRALPGDVLDLGGIGELGGIREDAGAWRIGARVTWTELLEAPLPRAFDCVKQAAREIGGVQIQNCGTLAGNLCNASPAADGVPALLALDASVELASARGARVLPLGDFLLGSRKTACAADELVTAVLVPRHARDARSAFLKLGARRYLVISIAMVAAVVEVRADRTIARAAIAVGACSPVARRLEQLERDLAGQPLAPGIGGMVVAAHLASLAPISDVRGTALYRRDAAATLVARALERLADE
jgi:CO/xanthine dehydrogenase FAD-binding subunit